MSIFNSNKRIYLLWILLLIFLAGCASKMPEVEISPIPALLPTATLPPSFDGDRALRDVAHQVEMGPRFPGSEGHKEVRLWIKNALAEAGWTVEIPETIYAGRQVYNIEAVQHEQLEGLLWVIIGAHYDTRMTADHDPDPEKRSEPVLGANDGASGVAVLLELARILPSDLDVNLSLVFFDAEDNGGIEGWDWILGSRSYVEGLNSYPDQVVIVDMVGDADQQIYLEKSSDPVLAAEIWQIAEQMNINTFVQEAKYHIIDDHTPFLEKGIPSVDIIDFEYAYWHTTQDTLDKVDSTSLKNVGDVLLEWLVQSYQK